MKVLYSNMLPLGTQDNQETIDESIRKQIEKADRADIAVGYVSLASLEELDRIICESSVKQITLVIGMYYIEGMPEKIYYTALKINKKWRDMGIGEVRIVRPLKYHGKVYCFYKDGKANNAEFKAEIARHVSNLSPQKSDKQPDDVLISKAESLVANDEISVYIMNGTNEVDSSAYAQGSNIVIGGNTLGRGVTFPGLQTIYYTRTSKKPQADTMWQHSRMFGYDRDPGMMMIYIDEHLYKLFSDINATNNSIIAQIERGIDDVKIYYPEGLNPTRKNVLDNKHVEIISGGTNYYPFYPDNDSIEGISELLKTFDNTDPYYQVSLRFIKEVLSHIIPSPDFKLSAFMSVLDTMLADTPTGQGILIVRRERDVAQGTGALLSPNDWKLGGQFTDKPVLTMYQVTGNKGWNGRKLWIPNIKLPHGTMYYDVTEESE